MTALLPVSVKPRPPLERPPRCRSGPTITTRLPQSLRLHRGDHAGGRAAVDDEIELGQQWSARRRRQRTDDRGSASEDMTVQEGSRRVHTWSHSSNNTFSARRASANADS